MNKKMNTQNKVMYVETVATKVASLVVRHFDLHAECKRYEKLTETDKVTVKKLAAEKIVKALAN